MGGHPVNGTSASTCWGEQRAPFIFLLASLMSPAGGRIKTRDPAEEILRGEGGPRAFESAALETHAFVSARNIGSATRRHRGCANRAREGVPRSKRVPTLVYFGRMARECDNRPLWEQPGFGRRVYIARCSPTFRVHASVTGRVQLHSHPSARREDG